MASLAETVTNVGACFLIVLLGQQIILPVFAIHLGPAAHFGTATLHAHVAGALLPGRPASGKVSLMRGRKPVPTALRLVTGNAGHRPVNPLEPKPHVGIPACSGPSVAERQVGVEAAGARAARPWRDQRTRSRRPRRLCQAYGRWVEAERKLKETPPLLKTPAGFVQPSPWLGIANKNLELMHKFMCELGLSPVSRTRVSARPLTRKPWEFDDDDQFFG